MGGASLVKACAVPGDEAEGAFTGQDALQALCRAACAVGNRRLGCPARVIAPFCLPGLKRYPAGA